MPDSKPQATERKLTLKQSLFVEAYIGVANGNATEAARIAGYKIPALQGHENLNKPNIRARVEKRLAKSAATADQVLGELTDIAMADWREFFDIIKRDPKTGEPIQIKFDLSNKVKSLELLGKHHQLFTENINHSGSMTREYVIIRDGDDQ